MHDPRDVTTDPPPGAPAPGAAGPAADIPAGGPEATADAPDAAAAAELERLAAERDEYLDALRRMKAEFDNYRRRTERERPVLAQAGVRELVADLLPVLDNLERAVEAMAGPGDAAAGGVVAGVEMVRQQLSGLLGGRGVEEIAAHEQPFDPQVHEAVYSAPSEHPEGTVVAVVERGYRMNDAVIRPAKVVVSGGTPGEA